MTEKIAITGLPECNKSLIAQALSIMTVISCIRSKTMYEWEKMLTMSDAAGINLKDMILVASTSFFERIRIESCYDQFISDGASFSELLWLKINFAKRLKGKMRDEWAKFEESIENASFVYAAQKYDFIVHANSSVIDRLSNDFFVSFYLKYNIPHKIYDTAFPEKTLMEIIHDLNLPIRNTVEMSIFQANTNLFNNQY